MRIAYIINSMEGGGAASPVPALVDVMRAAGADVRVFALVRRDGLAIPHFLQNGIEPVVREGGETDHVAAVRWLDRQCSAFAPTHLWTSLTRATLLGQILGAYRRIPVVSWQHAAYLKPANLRLLRLTQRLSMLWVADSETIAELTAARLGVPHARLATWPIFSANAQAPVANPWIEGEKVRIGSLGRLHRVKGFDVLIEALAKLGMDERRFEVEIAGEGAERQALEDLARARGLNNVAFTGFCADAPAFLARIHLYVQPSRSEGFCIAAHEAMLAGLPVIASAVGELPRSIDQQIGCIVPADDPDRLAAALRELLSMPKLLAPMGKAARQRALDRFGRERFEAAGLQILQRVGALKR